MLFGIKWIFHHIMRPNGEPFEEVSLRSIKPTDNLEKDVCQILKNSFPNNENINAYVDQKTKEITLTYKENVIAIEFAALHYYSPGKNKYE